MASDAPRLRGVRPAIIVVLVTLVAATTLLVVSDAGVGIRRLVLQALLPGNPIDARTTTIETQAPIVRRDDRLAAYSLFRDCAACPALVVVDGDTGAVAIGRTEVSVADWAFCTRYGSCRELGALGAAANLPATRLTRFDAQTYVDFLSARTGRSYTLLDQAGWIAAFGDASAEIASIGRQTEGPQRVGYAANSSGIYDLIGNVTEWADDCVDSAYQYDCRVYAVQGGSWLDSVQSIQDGVPRGALSNTARDDLGLRVMRAVQQ